MPVREFLATHTSRELAELRAYEVANGPIGPAYEREALASIHEALQALRLTAAAVAGAPQDDVTGPDGKSLDIKRYPRVGLPLDDDEEAEED